MEKYTFDEKRHIHLLNEKPLMGVTTILSVISKPALIPWSANMVVKWIKENAERTQELIPHYILTEAQLEEARKAHTKRKEKAGAFGTHLHADIERWINNWMAVEAGSAAEDVPAAFDDRIKPFIDWAHTNNVKFMASEKHIYSEKMWTGGIVDFICEIDGKRWIGDIKTASSGIYPENFWQTASYDMMLQEMGDPKAKGYVILNLKENGEFIEKRNISTKDNQEAFKSCLNIYRTLEKLKTKL